MNKDKYKDIEFVIGIDLGHGETSAAICPIQWDTPESQLEPVKDLDMGSNRKVIPSAITIYCCPIKLPFDLITVYNCR